jgi:hypothetical protein
MFRDKKATGGRSSRYSPTNGDERPPMPWQKFHSYWQNSYHFRDSTIPRTGPGQASVSGFSHLPQFGTAIATDALWEKCDEQATDCRRLHCPTAGVVHVLRRLLAEGDLLMAIDGYPTIADRRSATMKG